MQGHASRLFVFEGPDAVGKTTLVGAIADNLRNRGARVVVGASPGLSPGTLGRLVYDLHHEPEKFGLKTLGPASLQLLHVAAHLDAIHSWIEPARSNRTIVLLDRFWWSTAVYGRVAGLSDEMVAKILEPELVYWRRKPPDSVLLVNRKSHQTPTTEDALALGYHRIAALENENGKVLSVDNNGTIETTVAGVMRHIDQLDGDE